MHSIQVYEYHDGHQHMPGINGKVQYFVIGKVRSKKIVICYCKNSEFITHISSLCHMVAWETNKIDLAEAVKYLHSAKNKLTKYTIDNKIYELYNKIILLQREQEESYKKLGIMIYLLTKHYDIEAEISSIKIK
jgi:hypothetical protein